MACLVATLLLPAPHQAIYGFQSLPSLTLQLSSPLQVDASAAGRVLSALSIAPWPASSPPAAVPAVTTRLTAPTAPSAGAAIPRVVVCPWTDYAAARSAASDRAVAARAAAAAASNGRPAKRSRVEAEAGAQAGAEEARPEERPWCSIM